MYPQNEGILYKMLYIGDTKIRKTRAVKGSDYSPAAVPSEGKDTCVEKFWCLKLGEKDGMNLLWKLKTYQDT